MDAFERFTDLLEIINEDVLMRSFCQSVHIDARLWFRNVEADSIISWIDLHDVFLRFWGENKSYDQYLTELYALKRRRDETVSQFNRKFHSFYLNMPKEIQPSKIVVMVHYTVAQHPNLFIYLRERKA